MEGYKCDIIYELKELSPLEKVKIKHLQGAIKIDEALKEGNLMIDVDNVVAIEVFNEMSESKQYIKYVYIDKDGEMYTSGSKSLFSEIISLCEDLKGISDFCKVMVITQPSKNYSGSFYTAVLV